MAVVVCTPRSLVSRADSRSSRALSSTVRVRAARSAILWEKRFAGARDRLAHAVEETAFGLFVGGFVRLLRFFAAKESS